MDREKLIGAGIDYDDGVHRFAGNPGMYEKYLLKFFDKNELPALRQALEREDYDAALRTAHNIKGEAGNLSISAFFTAICKMVDELRAGVHDESLLVLCRDAEKLYEAARAAVRGSLDE